MLARPPRAAPWLLVVGLLGAGCTFHGRREGIPYQYRQPLIDPESSPLDGPVAATPRAVREAPVARLQRDDDAAVARCRALAGRRYLGPRLAATRCLLADCLGAPVADTSARGADVEPRRDDPRPFDLVLFQGTRAAETSSAISDVGAVLAVRGARVEFLHLRGERAALGVLSLAQPNRRRLRGVAVENSYLRVVAPDDPPGTRYLAGQLLAGFATLRASTRPASAQPASAALPAWPL